MANRESRYKPDYVSPPGETLYELLEDLGMTQKELAERMNRPEKTINEIIKGKATITSDTAIQLEKVFKTPAHFWIQREARYQEYEARLREEKQLFNSIEWLKALPVTQMIKYNWIQKCENKLEQVQELLRYFSVASVESWKSIYLTNEPKAAFRISLAFTNENAAIAAWLRHGDINAIYKDIPTYDEKKFKHNLLLIKELTLKKSTFKDDLKRLCNEAGVNVVFTPMISKAAISGAVRWVGNRPLIQLSLRGKYNDRFWFTFFHEAGHIILHSKKDFFLEGMEDETMSNKEKEIEANDFAANFLIPQEKLKDFMNNNDKSPNAIIRLAKELGIHSGIVVGQLQNLGYINKSYMNDMKIILDIVMD